MKPVVRRPLLTVSIAFAVTIICAGIVYDQEPAAPDLSTPRKAAQAFSDALRRNDMVLAKSLALGNEEQLSVAKMRHDCLRALDRMQSARLRKFAKQQKDQIPDDYDSHLAKEDERIEGDKATIGGGFEWFMPTFKLERVGQTWKVDLRAEIVPSTSAATEGQRLLTEVNKITDNIEKGHYKTDQEVDDDLAAKFAAAAGRQPPVASETADDSNSTRQTPKARSENSLAVERYLRSRLVGGATENQIVQLSNAIAAKFDAADFPPKQRGYCITGAGDQRMILLYMLNQLADGELSPPETKSAAKQLRGTINHMIPPRAMFRGLFDDSPSPFSLGPPAKPLPAVEGPIDNDKRVAGSLSSEHLESFQKAIYELSGFMPPNNNKAFPVTYWNTVKEFQPGYVLRCQYQGEYTDSVSRPYYFWYQKVPDGLNEVLHNIPTDHPIHQIGPPQDAAPSNLVLAMKANVESAELVKKAIAAEKTKPVTPSDSGLTNEQKIWTALGMIFGGAVIAEALSNHSGPQIGPDELECPRCRGSGLVPNTSYDYFYNSTDHPFDYSNNANPTHLACPKCSGSGKIKK